MAENMAGQCREAPRDPHPLPLLCARPPVPSQDAPRRQTAWGGGAWFRCLLEEQRPQAPTPIQAREVTRGQRDTCRHVSQASCPAPPGAVRAVGSPHGDDHQGRSSSGRASPCLPPHQRHGDPARKPLPLPTSPAPRPHCCPLCPTLRQPTASALALVSPRETTSPRQPTAEPPVTAGTGLAQGCRCSQRLCPVADRQEAPKGDVPPWR